MTNDLELLEERARLAEEREAMAARQLDQVQLQVDASQEAATYLRETLSERSVQLGSLLQPTWANVWGAFRRWLAARGRTRGYEASASDPGRR